MSKQYIKDKNGNIIGEYNPKAKGYRYYIKGDAKSSVTTKIGKRTKPDFQNWYKSNRDNSIKEIMIMEDKPIDQINKFVQKVKERAESKESYGREIGSELHEWIDLYFKSKNQPAFPESEPLKTMSKKWLSFWKLQKFKLIASETPLYSPKFDTCGCNDVIVTKDSWKGQKAVIDWKTSKDYTFDQPIQVEMYRRFIEETTNFKIQKLAIVNIPKEPEKEVSMFIVKAKEYFKAFQAITYLDDMESKFKDDLKKWKKENKANV